MADTREKYLPQKGARRIVEYLDEGLKKKQDKIEFPSDSGKYLNGDGGWSTPTDTTYSKFSRSDDGLVPAAPGNTTTKYLREDGKWEIPPNDNTTYGAVTTEQPGLTPKLSGISSQYLNGQGEWTTPKTEDLELTFGELEKKVNSLNDITTTSNLVRGTRDFKAGTQKFGTSPYFTDGWQALTSNFTLSKDSEGFGVITGTCAVSDNYQALVDGEIAQGDEFTLAVEFKIDSVAAYNGNDVMVAAIQADNNTSIWSTAITFDNCGLTKAEIPDGKWVQAVYHLNLTQANITSAHRLRVGVRVSNGTIQFRKFNVQHGNVIHPAWSASPFDTPDVGSEVNDYTTGINLIRGSRDFAQSTKNAPENQYIALNGFRAQGPQEGVSFSVDNQGFTILNVKRSGLSAYSFAGVASSGIYDLEKGETYTVAFEYMVDDLSELDSKIISNVAIYHGSAGISGQTYPTVNIGSDIKAGVWYTCCYYLTITADVVPTDILLIRIGTGMNGSMHFKRLCVYKGKINNPVWSASPFDAVDASALESINDETTGINLIRGTRDFTSGSQKWANINYTLDGFYPGAANVWSVIEDKGEFSILRYDRSGLTSNSTSLYIGLVDAKSKGLKAGDKITICFETRVNEYRSSTPSTTLYQILYRKPTTDGPSHTIAWSTLGLNPATMKKDVWNRVVYVYTLPRDLEDDEILRCSFCCNGNGSFDFRKLCIYAGEVNNPIWSASPFDAVSNSALSAINDMTTGINLLRGTRDFRIGTQKFGSSSFMLDGCGISSGNWKIEKLDDGFSQICVESGVSQNSYFRCSAFANTGETIYTVSGEIKLNKPITTMSRAFVRIVGITETGSEVGSLSATFENAGVDNSNTSQWQTWKYVFDTTKIKTAVYYVVDFFYPANGTDSYAIVRPVANHGSINNSLWSASPFDIDAINDVTTGINLLRGTRDFDEGIKEKLGDYYSDGFGSLTSRNILKKVESNGFTSLTYINNGEYTSFAIGAVQAVRRGIKAGDVLTVSFLFRRNAEFSYTNEAFVQISINGLSGSVQNFGTTYNNRYSVTNIEVGKWYPCVGEYVVPDGFVEGESFLRFDFRLNQTASNYSIMQPMIQMGSVDNPEWNYSPFDVASSSIVSRAYLSQGYLPAGTDINNFLEDGLWALHPNISTDLTNMPLNNVFGTFSVKHAIQAGQTGEKRGIIQELRTHGGSYLLRMMYDGSWGNWQKVFTNGSPVPIEGGGTNANSLAGAKSNLGITALEDALKKDALIATIGVFSGATATQAGTTGLVPAPPAGS